MDFAEDVADWVARMNIERDDLAIFGAMTFSIVIVAIFAMVLHNTQPKTTQETSITCTTNDSQLHALDGWKKIETVDYHRISTQVSKGKAQVECKPGSLMCTAFIEGKAFPETKGCAWYWRKV